jgi:hypothetical protein
VVKPVVIETRRHGQEVAPRSQRELVIRSLLTRPEHEPLGKQHGGACTRS